MGVLSAPRTRPNGRRDYGQPIRTTWGTAFQQGRAGYALVAGVTINGIRQVRKLLENCSGNAL